jgi:GT2 family glycosyltransferase
MIERLRTSVIICTRNRLDCLPVCLCSIARQTSLPDELIIIDSSDIPMMTQDRFKTIFTADMFPRTKLLYRHTKPGLTYQRNIGIDIARGDIVYFFDDDVIVDENYIKEMQRVFAGQPRFAGGSGTITNIAPYKFSFKYLMRIVFLIQRNYASGYFTKSGMPTHAYGSKFFQEVQVLGGCCCAYRASVFKSNRFDEYLVRYAFMEDCDFSKRVSKTNKLFYNPHAKLVHMQSPLNREKVFDFRTMFSHYYTYLFFKNFYRENKLRIFAYLWSMFGLFLEAVCSSITRRSMYYILGYWRGLFQFIRAQNNPQIQ